MLKLLFVEDQPEAVESVVDALKGGCRCEVEAFDRAESALEDFTPDIVILDILAGGASSEPDPTGLTTYDLIWNRRFCPIVVYSAHPELLSDTRESHPFVRFVRKGMSSGEELKKSIEELRPHAEAVRSAESRIRKEFSCALRDVAPDVFRIFDKEEDRKNAILRSAQRRLAALMDDLSRHGEKLQGWEQYLCPPFGDDLRLGDILRARNAAANEPSAFFLVLTPSCDLVASNGRSPKVADVLVACCYKMIDGINATSLKDLGEKKLKDRLPTGILSQGFLDGIIPLPQLEGRIPTMAANLKKLKLVPFSHIVAETPEFIRVASIDSPFRELVSWAYLQTACRPGLPDRDFDAWRDEIVSVYKADQVARHEGN